MKTWKKWKFEKKYKFEKNLNKNQPKNDKKMSKNFFFKLNSVVNTELEIVLEFGGAPSWKINVLKMRRWKVIEIYWKNFQN